MGCTDFCGVKKRAPLVVLPAILSYAYSSSEPALVAFPRLRHDFPAHETRKEADTIAWKRLDGRCSVGFDAVGSLKEEAMPKTFEIVGWV